MNVKYYFTCVKHHFTTHAILVGSVARGKNRTNSDHANTKYEVELQAVIKKRGSKDLAKYEVVATNISMVMAAIDSQARVGAALNLL